MILTPSFSDAISAKQLKVWVLAPCIESSDENIDYYYDFTQSIAEYQAVFEQLGISWQWQPVTMRGYSSVIEQIEQERDRENWLPVVLNLCDGDEVNGTPGISVLKMLEEKDIAYTGADAFFYDITTSKIPMKEAFDKAGVPNARWTVITEKETNAEEIMRQLGSPVIVKPAVSGGSMGVGIRNVVDSPAELSSLLRDLFNGYRGWNLVSGGIIAENFITGREFTVFISGSSDDPVNTVVYTPVERVFHASLPPKEKFLSFDRLWEIYEHESAMPGDENFYEYALPEAELIEPLKKLGWDAYCATNGKGYTRVDIRMDENSGNLYVLEVNAQCGISEDENFTSIGAILRFSEKRFSSLVLEILHDGWMRHQNKKISFAGRNARA